MDKIHDKTLTTNLPIHVAFCVNDLYSDYIRPAIKGLLENNTHEDITIHILSDYISNNNIFKLEEIICKYEHAKLNIKIVDDTILKGLKDTWTIYTWYRVLLPDILDNDIHRVLYLDADVMISGNIKKLFSINMNSIAIAGTIDTQSKASSTYERCGYNNIKEYVCAGIILMNLDYWRKNDIASKVIQWGRDNNDRIKFPDQDAINVICQDSKILLPLKYDILNGFFNDNYYYQHYKQDLIECLSDPKIIHYAGKAPWVKEKANHLLQDYWEKYNNSINNPVKRYYESKGLLLLKVWIYDFLFPKSRKRQNRIKKIRTILLKV